MLTKDEKRARCGGCTLCCELLEVSLLNKPANSNCPHCKCTTGCSIWDSRPNICRRYSCLWWANSMLSLELRPDQCGVLFEPVYKQKVMTANCDTNRPDSWRKSIAWRFINKCLKEGTSVIVIVGTEKHFLLSEGVRLQEVWDNIITGARQLGFVR